MQNTAEQQLTSFSRFLRHLAKKRWGLITQRSLAHTWAKRTKYDVCLFVTRDEFTRSTKSVFHSLVLVLNSSVDAHNRQTVLCTASRGKNAAELFWHNNSVWQTADVLAIRSGALCGFRAG